MKYPVVESSLSGLQKMMMEKNMISVLCPFGATLTLIIVCMYFGRRPSYTLPCEKLRRMKETRRVGRKIGNVLSKDYKLMFRRNNHHSHRLFSIASGPARIRLKRLYIWFLTQSDIIYEQEPRSRLQL